MTSKLFHRIIVVAGALLFAASLQANPGKPSFEPRIYGDGSTWGTKGTTNLPAPNEHNMHSYDGLYIFKDVAPEQLPVAEAAPGNPMYNGGRWIAYTVEWTADGIGFYVGNLPVITSFADLWLEHDAGHLGITPGHPAGPNYFQCPLLPNKES